MNMEHTLYVYSYLQKSLIIMYSLSSVGSELEFVDITAKLALCVIHN